MMYQLINSINWKDERRNNIKLKIEELNSEFEEEQGIKILNDSLDKRWKKYDTNEKYKNVALKFNSADIETSIRRADIVFSPTETGNDLGAKYHRDLDLVFARDDGYFICDTTFRDFVNKRLEEAGIEHHKIHSFRHSCATNFFEHKADIKKVSAWLGHSSIGITLDTYTHVLPHHLEELTEFQDKQFKHIFHSNEKDIPDEMLPHKTFAQEDDWGA